ncbi:MAG: hypothetical protein Q8P68_02805 [Candidatus Peregrinibacteria bacterium]|nr:hypothetical protein [Candidatus Peregrinibacteria bacterium]
MVFWKADETGVWAFDTNFGQLGEYIPAENGDLILENGTYRSLTQEEIETGTKGEYVWQHDNTIRLHKIAYSTLRTTNYATAYRLTTQNAEK